MVETHLADAGNDLTQIRVTELARNTRRHDRVDLVFRVVLAFLDHIDHVDNIRLIRDRAERALINTGAAGNAFAVIDFSASILIHAR